jgi:ribosomal protein L22
MADDDKKPEETQEPEAAVEETEATEAAAAEEKPKPKRAPRKKAAPKAEKAEAEETEAEEAKADEAEASAEEEAPAEEPVAEETPAEEKKPARKAPAKAAASRGRGAAREADAAPPVVRAQAKYVRTSARKARLVCEHIRGKSVEEARAILAFTPRAVAKDWAKLLDSAVANAEHNHELLGDDLKVAAAYADEGPTLKRFQPRAMGRATRIRKRTSHLTITLTPKG